MAKAVMVQLALVIRDCVINATAGVRLSISVSNPNLELRRFRAASTRCSAKELPSSSPLRYGSIIENCFARHRRFAASIAEGGYVGNVSAPSGRL